MSLPIKNTPVLTGEDAENFHRERENAEKRKLPKEIIERMNKNYKKMLKGFKKAKLI